MFVQFDKDYADSFYRDALTRYIEKINSASIVSITEKYKHVRDPHGPVHLYYDFDEFQKMDQHLRRKFGDWVPYAFSYGIVSPYKATPESIISIPANQLAEIVDKLVTQLTSLAEKLNEFIQQLHDSFPVDSKTNSGHGHQAIAGVITKILEKVIDETGCDDRWFYDVVYLSAIYMQSIDCPVTLGEMDDIADKHFSSWIMPEEDAAQRYADEIAALSVKRLFAERY